MTLEPTACPSRSDTGGDTGPVAGRVLLVAAVVLVAMNLRPTVTSVGPMLDEVRRDLGASASWAGLLTTVPVLCFAAAGLVAPALARRAGMRTTVAVALGLIAAGLLARVAGGPVSMLGATVVAALGVAVAGVLIPVVVKTAFPTKVGALTGLYTAALQGGAALGFALTPPLALALGGWRAALAAWAGLALVALAVWLVAGRPDEPAQPTGQTSPGSRDRSLWRSRLAWVVTAFFGLQAFVAFAVLGWLAQMLMSVGVSRGEAGLLMGLLTIIALPFSLVLPPLAARSGNQSGWIVGLSLCGLAGVVGFLVAPAAAPLLWTVLLGFGMSVFSLALTVLALRARTGNDTARLSGMAQGLGYLFAAAGPFAFGALHEVTGGWTAPFALLGAVLVAQTVTGAIAGRAGYV